MRRSLIAVAPVLVLAPFLLIAMTVYAEDKARVIRFQKSDIGGVPDEWKATRTGEGPIPKWKVMADETAPSKSGHVLAQTSKSPKTQFNLCVAPPPACKDVEVSVSFKPNAGEADQGGGILWRYQDKNNYYVARFNPLEDNFRVYKVIDGKRMQLETKEDLKAKVGEWHTLKIRHVGDRIECFYDGKKELEAKDDAIGKGGWVGLWTKADAQTSFDDLKITDLGK